jgi:hypothetical protein
MKQIMTLLLLCGMFALSAVSIYQIQYTNSPGRDNTFPSLYAGKTVTVDGIVTAAGFSGGGFFISEPSGGPWRGIYIETNRTGIKPGDKVIIKGIVDETFGMTCIRSIKSVSILDSNHPIPYPNQIATGQITSAEQAEAYEGTLVKVQNSTCVQPTLAGGRFSINDGSGVCMVDDAFLSGKKSLYHTGELFSAMCGIVVYSYGDYSINPRSRNDAVILAPVVNENRSWGRIKSIYK